MDQALKRTIKVYQENSATDTARTIFNATIRRRLHEYKCRFYYKGSIANSNKLINVNPTSIEYMVSPSFHTNVSLEGSYIIGGEWDMKEWVNNRDRSSTKDRRLFPLEKYEFLSACVNHFVNGKPWEETEFYQGLVADDKEETVKQRCEKTDNLYNKIKNEGYKTQRELETSLAISPPELNEVSVAIGRSGDVILDEGRHRFVISRILEIPTIPVRVKARHKHWQRIRYRIYKAEYSGIPDDLKRFVDHPDLQDLI